ncbi:MAG: hypothetical protein P4L66_12395 [Acetobacteraceae bacterium]|nr:hypothetical protein [Acetobacteraceae bacterium]
MSDTPKNSASSQALPNVDELKIDMQEVAPSAISPEYYENWSADSEQRYIHLRGLEDHYRHKGNWSWFLIALMAVMILFQCILLGMVGANIWSFEKYTWLLPALLVQNLAQVIGLAVFVVKALFKDMDGYWVSTQQNRRTEPS